MKIITKGLFSLLMSISFFAIGSDRPTLSQSQVIDLIKTQKSPEFTLLDVRSPKEFSAGHIATAQNISHNILADSLSRLPSNKDHMLVVYCRSGRRASVAEKILRKSGYTNVWHLEGDMNGWQASRLPVSQSEFPQ